jgi:hypothetical protein
MISQAVIQMVALKEREELERGLLRSAQAREAKAAGAGRELVPHAGPRSWAARVRAAAGRSGNAQRPSQPVCSADGTC